MKRHLEALILILIALAVLIPFASNLPDGLEKVAESLGIEEHTATWMGLMPDYALPTIEDPYISTLLAGTLGVFFVLGVAFMLGMAITKPNNQ